MQNTEYKAPREISKTAKDALILCLLLIVNTRATKGDNNANRFNQELTSDVELNAYCFVITSCCEVPLLGAVELEHCDSGKNKQHTNRREDKNFNFKMMSISNSSLTPSSAAVFKLWFYGILCAANHETAT